MFTEVPTLLEFVAPLLAEILLLFLVLAILTVDLFTGPSGQRGVGVFAAVGLFIIILVDAVGAIFFLGNPLFDEPVLGGMIVYDTMSLVFRSIVILAGALTCLIALDVPGLGRQGEFYAIVVTAVLGMSLMASAADLIMVFLALETTSISLYVLAGFLRTSPESSEAGVKYFMFGAFTTGFLLYALSLFYGFAGTTNIYELAGPLGTVLASGPAGVFALVVALLFLLVAFGFKISAVPFHFWTPDVYQGSPTPVTAFVSTASKAASFALLMRVFIAIFPAEAQVLWVGLLAAITAITMTFGNVLALVQTNIKRMLAYSSIAQAGYALIGVVVLTQTELGVASVAFYMFMYTLTNIAAFTVVIVVSNQLNTSEIKDFAGLNRRAPLLTLALVLSLLSLAGVPPLAGFFGKFFLFSAAVRGGFTWLAIIGVVNAIIALYYYLTIVKVMYVDEAPDDRPLPVGAANGTVLVITVVGIVALGIFAGPLWTWALDAATTIVAVVP